MTPSQNAAAPRTPLRARLRPALRPALAAGLAAFTALSLAAVPAGTAHAQEKRLKAWGNNRSGQLGDGTWTDFRTTSTTVLGLTSAEVDKIAAGGGGSTTGHGLALLKDRTVMSWGANSSGQLGDGSVFSHNAPGQVVNLSDGRDVAAGGWHSLALLADQTVVAWGRNNYGQLGNGTNSDSSVPVRVEGLNKVVAIAAGLNHSIALREDGTVWAWGYNINGQLGDGTSASRNVPAPVGGLSGVTEIAAGCNHNLALIGPPSGGTKPTSGNSVKAWGYNATGQLGDNSTINRYAPVDTQGIWLGGVSQIAAGCNHSLAVTDSDNKLKAWGQNTSGQVGDGTTDYRITPVPVPGIKGVQLVAGGREHTIALLGDNTVRSWGANGSGQLGNGTTTESSTPVTTLTALTGVDKIAAPVGGDFSLAN
ncbi:RCC1 domain-containing protein [Kitasatospora sp. NPDC001540]|uniref:RCC1 domain-containing protein n=1 Tax=Kitasatospora sp. NPDC001540 TaxID=3364014 RepID=UPI0036A565E7